MAGVLSHGALRAVTITKVTALDAVGQSWVSAQVAIRRSLLSVFCLTPI